MNFTEKVTSTMNKPIDFTQFLPPGYYQSVAIPETFPPEVTELTPAEYAELTKDQQRAWMPEYKTFKLKIVPEFDECGECGRSEFIGHTYERRPSGEPFRYVPMSRMTRHVIDAMERSNEIAIRTMGRFYDATPPTTN